MGLYDGNAENCLHTKGSSKTLTTYLGTYEDDISKIRPSAMSSDGISLGGRQDKH